MSLESEADLSPRLRAALGTFAAALRARLGPSISSLRLFGSYARGEAHTDSDVDVLVVLDRASWSERRMVLDLAADVGLEHELLLSPTILDRETFDRWRRQERALVMDAEREGLAL